MQVLLKQPTEQEPYIVNNYPYGFLRTQIRFYVETTKKGQRFVSQTLNPKTQIWNKPKKSTYSQIIIVGKDEKGHINYVDLSASYRTEAEAKEFFEKYGMYFSSYQLKEYNGIIGMLKVFDKVKFTIRTQKFKHKITGNIIEQVPLFDMKNYIEVDDEGNEINEEKYRQEQKEINKIINKNAVISAKKQQKGTIEESINTFKRA